MQEQGVNQWEKEARVVKTSEDQYERADSNSSKSSTAEENLSPKSNTHNTPSMLQQQPAIKPDFNRLIYPPTKAQSLIDTRVPGRSVKKSPSQYPNNKKTKNTLSNHHQLHQNHTHSFYSSLSSMGTNGLQYQAAKNRQTTKNSPMPFLPPVSGASAFSNYSTNTGHTTSIVNKVNIFIFMT